ncbi:MAG: phosphatase PAP2 family protein [Flammeovirgaceae bacterium]
METLQQIGRELFLFLNGLHSDMLDPIMSFLTRILAWLPLYLVMIYWVIKTFKGNAWIYLVGAAVAIASADQFTSALMKPFFARLRPSHEPTLKGLVHLVNHYRGGLYGFASGHAATTFAVATFVWLSLRHAYRHMAWIFAWAVMMTYTRIYLGVHYPSDIVVGATIGCLFGTAVWKLTTTLEAKLEKRKRA